MNKESISNNDSESGRRNLGILGAGRIGQAVGGHWIRAGHEVSFGSRTPDKLQPFIEGLGPRAYAKTFSDAAKSDIILLSVPYEAVDEVVEGVRVPLTEKIVIDATNPFGLSSGGRIISTLDADITAGTRMAKRLQDSIVVRAFSHVMDELLVSRGSSQPDLWAMAIAGDVPEAKNVVADLVRDTGFIPVDIGNLAGSAPLDPGGILFPNMFTESDMRAILRS